MLSRSWNSRFAVAGLLFTALATAFAATPIAGQEPLHVQIDRLIEAGQLGPVAEPVSDEEFARRIYLDLTGAVPSITELRAFLADTSPNKRQALVERLLASPQFVRHLTITLDVMLLERRAVKNVTADEWQNYLYESVAQNKPWNQLARELLAADGTDEKIRPAAAFYLTRDGEPNLLTRDVGRIFFGMDLGCCQCHDHPLIDSYLQSDYHGLYAFLNRGFLFTDKDKKVFFAEKAEGDVKFSSVFTKVADEMRPRLPGELEIDEPVFLKGDEYSTAPAENVRPVPKFSRRAHLAELATTGTNRAFNRNIANRLWAVMLGRGLVEPLDMHHLDNPPANAELVELLGEEFARMKFDMKAFLREVALTKVYQRSLRLPESPALAPAVQLATQQQPALEAQSQQLSQTVTQTIAARDQLDKTYDAARKALHATFAELAKVNESIAAANKVVADTAKALAEAQQQLAAKKDVTTAIVEAANKATEASAKLPEEKELAQAAEKFKARAAQLTAELTAAEKLVTDRTAPATNATAALEAAKGTATPVLEKVTAARKSVVELQPAYREINEKLRREQLASVITKSRLEAARSLIALGGLQVAVEEGKKNASAIQNQIATGKQTLATLTAQLPALQSTLSAATSANDASAKQLAEAQAQLNARQQAMQLIAETAAKSEAASQKLPQDAELKQITQSLVARRDQLTAETTALQKTVADADQQAKAAAAQLAAAQQAMTAATTQIDSLQKSIPTLESQLPGVQAKLASDEVAYNVAFNTATETWSKHFHSAPLEPLTPEQMGWSILKVTGITDQYRAAAEAEVNKTHPLDPAAPADPAKIAEREKLIEQQVYAKLKGPVGTFINLFGHAGGQPQRDFFATVDQALFFSNGGVLQSWLNPGGENLMARLNKLTDPRAVAEEMYMSILIRKPAEEEIGAVTKYLEGRTNDRLVALQEMAWALITSTEFRFQ